MSDLLAFLDAAPTPYHAVHETARRLRAGGFAELDETLSWDVGPGHARHVVRDGTLVAFVLGQKPPSETGFVLIGAHTDSPNLRLKPLPETNSVGYAQLAVEVYGGVLWSTWLDRDLSVAGRLVLADGSERLVRSSDPVCRIPNLAIHLNRDVNSKGLLLDPQLHLSPILGAFKEGGPGALERLLGRLSPAELGGARAEDVLGFDLCLFDAQAAATGGVDGDLIFAARLDNLASCHAATSALLASPSDADTTRVMVLYDHEEVGSQSATGARSRLLERILDRLAQARSPTDPEAVARAYARSLMTSVDMAHGVHPNYADKHDLTHRPVLGKGPVIKVNAHQAYATDGPAVAAFLAASRKVGVEPQYFVSRNDLPCGSTIGPISAARLGMRTADVGNPMLSMHSCREMAGTGDVAPMISVLTQLLSAR